MAKEKSKGKNKHGAESPRSSNSRIARQSGTLQEGEPSSKSKLLEKAKKAEKDTKKKPKADKPPKKSKDNKKKKRDRRGKKLGAPEVDISAKRGSSGKGKSKGKGKEKGKKSKSSSRRRKKHGDIEIIEENLYSEAEDVLLDKIDAKDSSAVKDLVSDEIYNPAGTDVVEYGDAKVWDFTKATQEFTLDSDKIMEIDHSKNVTVLNIEDTVKVIDIDGSEITEAPVEEEEPKKGRRSRKSRRRNKGKKGGKSRKSTIKRKIIDESKLKFDPLEQIEQYKKNWDQYALKCEVCQNSHRCQTCEGTGRRFFIFRCKTCGGNGRCPECHTVYKVPCQNCKKKMLNFSPRCFECGHEHRCPTCFTPLPVSATKCFVCRTDFICRRCKLPIAPGYEKRCPRCDARVEQALY